MKQPRIIQLPSGNFSAQVMVDGKRYCVTRKKQSEVMEAIEDLRKGRQVFSADMTVEQAVKAYIDDKAAVLSPSTIGGYRTCLRDYFQQMLPRKAGSITDKQWQVAISKEAQRVSAKTIKNAWGLFSAALAYNGYDVPSVKLPQIVANEHEWLDPDQIQTFLAAIKGKRVEVPALLALHGLRKSELLALDWSKIDMDKDLITVSGAMVKDENGDFVMKKTNKNATSNRVVPIIIPRLKEAILEADKDKPLITYAPTSLYKAINNACRDAGLPAVGIHGLRHSAVSLAYSLGMNEMACMTMFGYSDFQTMRKIYTHLAQRDMSRSVENMRRFFS